MAGDLCSAMTRDLHLLDGLCSTERTDNRIMRVLHEFVVALRCRRSASQYFGQRPEGVFYHRVTVHKRWRRLTTSGSVVSDDSCSSYDEIEFELANVKLTKRGQEIDKLLLPRAR